MQFILLLSLFISLQLFFLYMCHYLSHVWLRMRLIVTNFDTKWTERIIKSCNLLYHFFCLSPFFWKILQLFFNIFESFLTFLITLACIIQRLLNLARVLHIRHSLGDLDLNFTLFFIYSHKCFSGNKFKILHTVKGFIKGFY